jgi:hypothetical protein
MTTIAIALKGGFWHPFCPTPLPLALPTNELRLFVNFYTAFPPVFHIEFRGETSKKMCMEYWVPLPPMQRANNAGKFAPANLQRMFRIFALLNKS